VALVGGTLPAQSEKMMTLPEAALITAVAAIIPGRRCGDFRAEKAGRRGSSLLYKACRGPAITRRRDL
jgi:hypothetical protein